MIGNGTPRAELLADAAVNEQPRAADEAIVFRVY
jgi:hypothetical protein